MEYPCILVTGVTCELYLVGWVQVPVGRPMSSHSNDSTSKKNGVESEVRVKDPLCVYVLITNKKY